MKYNAWIVLSDAAIQEYREKRDNPEYSGPMTDAIFKGLSRVKDGDVVTGLFKPFTFGGKTYRMFSLYFDKTDPVEKIKELFDLLTAQWPDHFQVIGVWRVEDGLQVGTRYDEDGETVIGTPTYPIHNAAWRFMPDTPATYDAQGNVLTWDSATSNADLRDVNLLVGQQPRNFD